MEKRKLLLGGYDTAEELWTLCSWKLSDPTHEQNFIKIPGSSVTLDLSTALTDGEPAYNTRTLTATLESSEGDRLERKARIYDMVNRLDGRRMDIILPDDPGLYITGRVSVKVDYNDLAHASVSITAVCEPWRHNNTETIVTFSSTSTEKTSTVANNGRKPVIPTLEVTGSVTLTFEEKTHALTAGTYILPDLYLTPGDHDLTYSGTGTLTLTYREAVL